MYAFLADLIVAFHTAYISFVLVGLAAILVGAFLKWKWIRNPWFRWTHLIAIAIVALEAIVGMTCPLTDWEHNLRDLAGQQHTDMSFIGGLLHNLIFIEASQWVLNLIYIGFALVVALTLLLVPPRGRRVQTR
jgi:hypothetical protein